MDKKRIIELATETTLKDGQYVAIDHTTDGTKKLNLGAELTDLKEDLADETTARENADSKMASEISDLFEMATPSAYNNDKVPYLFRQSGGGKYIGGIEKDTIVGGTVAWNQLCNGSSVTVPNGHKYYMVKGGTASIGASTGTAITGLTSGTDIVSDLTQLFGSTIADYIYSLEQATAGSGIAKLKSWGFFTEDYYAYDSGSLKSVESLVSHDMVGFNQWDEEWELGSLNGNGVPYVNANAIRSKNFIHVKTNTSYYYYNGSNVNQNFWCYGINKEYLGRLGTYIFNGVFTTPEKCHYIKISLPSNYGPIYKNDICINLSDSTKNGSYEPYEKHSYALDSDLTLRGIPKLDSGNNLYYDGDVYASDGTVTRYWGERAYQSGDASNGSTMITDGTKTVYKLSTSTTETADPYQNPQLVDKDGTEEYVTTGIVPVGHDTDYYLDADSVLTPPSTAGTYSLKVTVASDGSKSYSWVSD